MHTSFVAVGVDVVVVVVVAVAIARLAQQSASELARTNTPTG